MYIKDEATINAYAYGSNTIVITRGALESFDEEQLKGLLAHEFGHLANGDTRMLLALTIGCGFFSLFYGLIKLIVRVLNFLIRYNFAKSFLHVIHLVYAFVLKMIRFVFVKIMQFMQTISALLIGLGGRSNQYRADEFACEAGYREQLLSALYLLHEMNVVASGSLMERLKSGGPHIASRIARLERMH